MDRRVSEGRVRVLHSVLAAHQMSPGRGQLAHLAGLSPRTLDSHVSALRECGLLAAGRTYRLGSAAGLVLSIMVRSETVQAALVGPHGEFVHSCELPPRPGQRQMMPRSLVFERLLPVVEELFETLPGQVPRPTRLLGVVTSWPTPMSRDGRTLGSAMNSAWRTGGSLIAATAAALGVDERRVHAINDGYVHALGASHDHSVKAAALAARRELIDPGHARVNPHLYPDRATITLHLGGVLGGGVVVQHRETPGARLGFIDSILIGGNHGRAGEIAHLPVTEKMLRDLSDEGGYMELEAIDVDRRCFCGNPRHLQCHVSDDSVRARVPNLERATMHEFLASEDFDHDGLKWALRHAGRLVGLVMMSPLKLLDPQTLNLTGILARTETREGIRRGLADRAWTGDEIEIHVPDPADNRWLGVRGAALVIFRSKVYRNIERLAVDGPTEDFLFNFPCPRSGRVASP